MNIPQFHVVSLFPSLIDAGLRVGVIGRALETGLFAYQTYQLRDFSEDKHHSVDDVAYGGGGGMVLKIEPLVRAVECIRARVEPEVARVVLFSPSGHRMTQEFLERFHPMSSSVRHWILICGRYEGVDERFIEGWVDIEVSLGDFVVTGGEIPALAFVDALVRQLEGALGSDAGASIDSFRLRDSSGSPLLEHPQYTRPSDFRGRQVPSILLSGDHAQVQHWRSSQSKSRTVQRRPDLIQSDL